MAGNIFGNIFKLTTFGESHGPALGGVIDGCPSGLKIDLNAIQVEMDRRKPGQSAIVTQRKEPDSVTFYSGVFEGETTGTPIGFLIHNTDQKSKDYSHIKDSYRPSHADYVYDKKYGNRDYRGGGRSSARETACRVVAGAIAKQILSEIKIIAFVSSVGKIKIDKHYSDLDFSEIEKNPVRCADSATALLMENHIKDLGKAMLSINAVKGFEFGSGFEGTKLKGSQHNDSFDKDGKTKTNNSGGIQGGISNGMDIYFNVAFKPVATIMKAQQTIDSNSNVVEIKGKGRHDPCVVPRAVPIVEAMAALVLVDFFLLNRTIKL